MERVIFEVPGKPQGKGRPRASVVGGHARMYTPAGTASYENRIMLCYLTRPAVQRTVEIHGEALEDYGQGEYRVEAVRSAFIGGIHPKNPTLIEAVRVKW